MVKMLFISLLSVCALYGNEKAEKKTPVSFSYYHMTAERLDIDIVNSYPQSVIEFISMENPYDIVVRTFSAHEDCNRRERVESAVLRPRGYAAGYPEEVRKYLESTSLIQCDSPAIRAIADSLADYHKGLSENLVRILKWVSSRIAFDKELANKISAGEVNTQSALTTLERGKGTCSEYTNLFAAIMRNLGVPTRFIVGVISENGHRIYHAWAECYIEGAGWHGVDPQTAQLWIPAMGIKLFAGKDFMDCRIDRLPDIKAAVENLKYSEENPQ